MIEIFGQTSWEEIYIDILVAWRDSSVEQYNGTAGFGGDYLHGYQNKCHGNIRLSLTMQHNMSNNAPSQNAFKKNTIIQRHTYENLLKYKLMDADPQFHALHNMTL